MSSDRFGRVEQLLGVARNFTHVPWNLHRNVAQLWAEADPKQIEWILRAGPEQNFRIVNEFVLAVDYDADTRDLVRELHANHVNPILFERGLRVPEFKGKTEVVAYIVEVHPHRCDSNFVLANVLLNQCGLRGAIPVELFALLKAAFGGDERAETSFIPTDKLVAAGACNSFHDLVVYSSWTDPFEGPPSLGVMTNPTELRQAWTSGDRILAIRA